jgi:hypothetical protein
LNPARNRATVGAATLAIGFARSKEKHLRVIFIFSEPKSLGLPSEAKPPNRMLLIADEAAVSFAR